METPVITNNNPLHNQTITRGIRNNNPFNIRKSKSQWRGKIRKSTDKDFEQFTDVVYGVRAGLILISRYVREYGLTTFREIITRYAPPSENDVDSYCTFFFSTYNISPDQEIFEPKTAPDVLLLGVVASAICWYESKYNLTFDMYFRVISNFHIGVNYPISQF